jgi:hypothetical protein
MRTKYGALKHSCGRIGCLILVLLLFCPAACQTTHQGGRSAVSRKHGEIVRRVRCLYEQRPWLNLDRAGDRDPEGIRFRAFLDQGDGYGVHRKGTFHVEMYLIGRDEDGKLSRTLVSDWIYPTDDVHRIAKPGKLGDGYYLYLRWAKKSIAGHEVEIITQFEDEDGNVARSGTKRLPVPKYTS